MTGASRRDFLRAGLAAAAVGLLPGCRDTGLGPASEDLPEYLPGEALPWRNWGGNQGCRPTKRAAPGSEQELAEVVRDTTTALRPVGTGHSFSALVPSDGTLVACDLMSGVIEADARRNEAEVWAGTRLHQLGPALQTHGQAMSNLPDIDYPTLGGAIATSTHGTGHGFGSLSSMVRGLTLITPSGDLLECSEEQNPEIFQGARCSLGALGVVSRVRLRNQPSFELTESTSFEPLGDLLDDLDARWKKHRHFEFYAFPHTEVAMAIATDEGRQEPTPTLEFEGDPLEAMRNAYRSVGGIPILGTQLYEGLVGGMAETPISIRSGPSYEVLTHTRISRFREMEYTVPIEAGAECLREILETIREQAIPVVFPIEVRTIAADDVWLSMFQGRDGCSISIHQFADEDYRPYFDAIEPVFWKFSGRPHWGKLHSLTAPRFAELYPHWQDFLQLRESLDPSGKMLNAHLGGVFGLAQGTGGELRS